ncbi:tudor domain-containing protein [Phthorimaea operculella]|nr:tudor domain-containing protein [Phthorimaea operculella]
MSGSGHGYHYQRPIVQPVQPFAESQHPKQLHEGAQELIYISHIVDPHNFFVQRACHQHLVKEMLREFRNAASLPKPSLKTLAEGKVYLMFNKADNMWQRCRVISINRKDPNNPLFLVFCIDFGSTETVSIDKLRLLPPARVQSPLPLAINCSLANCEPKAGGWTADDAFLIQNIIDNKQAIIYVRHIRSTANYSMRLECDVLTFSEGISLAHALRFHDRARMPNSKLVVSRVYIQPAIIYIRSQANYSTLPRPRAHAQLQTSGESLYIQQAIIYIRSQANYSMRLECDVLTFSEGISLAHALRFHDRARMPNSKLVVSRVYIQPAIIYIRSQANYSTLPRPRAHAQLQTSGESLYIQQAIIYIRSQANYSMRLECDVLTFSEGISLAHALRFHDRARMPNSKLVVSRVYIQPAIIYIRSQANYTMLPRPRAHAQLQTGGESCIHTASNHLHTVTGQLLILPRPRAHAQLQTSGESLYIQQAIIYIRSQANYSMRLECDVLTFSEGISLAHALRFHDRARMPNSKLVQAIIYIRSQANYSMRLECDVLTFSEGISLAHALRFHDRARMPNSKLVLAATYTYSKQSSTYGHRPTTRCYHDRARMPNSKLVQAIIYIRSQANYSMRLECDVLTFSEGISLAHALRFHDRARMPNSKLVLAATYTYSKQSSTYGHRPTTRCYHDRARMPNSKLVQAIIYIRSQANYSMRLECDVLTFSEGISLAHALRFHDRARMPNSKLVYPKITGVMDKPKIFMGANDLKPKTVEEVYITHIVSPDKFYVRKKHLTAVYESLYADLEQEYSGNKKYGNVYLPEVGMSYVVNLDKVPAGSDTGIEVGTSWARAVCEELPGRGRVSVHLVDTGARVLVSWTALRYIHQQFTTQRALATECYLAGVTPLNKKWSAASVALLSRFTERLLELHVEDARRGAAGVTLFDRADPDNSVCVNTEMIKYKYAVTFGLFMFNKNAAVEDQVFTNKSPLDPPQVHAKPGGPVQVLQRNAKKINEAELEAKDKGPLRLEAKVLHYQSPSLIYVSLVHQQKAFSELYEEIQNHYAKKGKEPTKKDWAIGDRCCTFCTQSQTWRRAAIVEIQNETAKVFYSDFACVESVPVSSLRELTQEFMVMGDAAIKCHLCGIGNEACVESVPVSSLRELTQEFMVMGDAAIKCHLCGIGNEACVESVPVNSLRELTQEFMVMGDAAIKCHLCGIGNEACVESVPVSSLRELTQEFMVMGDAAIKCHLCGIGMTRCQTQVMKRVWSVPVSSLRELTQEFMVMGDAAIKCHLCGIGNEACVESVPVSSLRELTQEFMVMGDAAIKCHLCGIGNEACVESVPVSSLRELTQEFMVMGDAAIKCHLCGIVPADGSDEWPTITKEYLKELLDAYPRVFITKLGHFKNKSMPVEVWVYHTIQGGALEPNKSEWRCLNKKIIEQGLGIPDKTHQKSTEAETTNDEMLSFLKNVTGSVDEWLQLEPLPQKPLEQHASPATSPQPEDEKRDANDIYVTDWLPPEPLTCKEFTAMPTYIDNSGVIYLHDVTQQGTLDLIRQGLDVRFKAPDPKVKYHKWTVGEPCIAMFFLDKRFYRGRVIDVNEEARSCLIHYVDYGNEELCSFENLRKSIVFHSIPVQARKCMLARIRPVNPTWDRVTLDYIHKSVVEKQCLVRVVGEPIGDVTPIDLKYDKLWINDHLVDFEMAVYTDGSKPVVRKFAGDKKKRATPPPPPPPAHDDSGPDYIIDDDASATPSSALSLDGKDWNKLVEEELNDAIEGRFITYPDNNLGEFECTITLLNDLNTLELSLVLAPDVADIYERMYEAVQTAGYEQSPLNGIYEHKACIALFPEDGQWYRATILQFSEAKSCVKVRYVDYGNIEIVPLADVREINEEWAELPAATVRAKLADYTPNPQVDRATLSQAYIDTFLDKDTFHGKVVKYDDGIPLVELRDDDGKLVYEQLIQKEILIKSD